MDCQSIQDHFTEYHEKELASDVATIIEQHLESCSDCAKEWHYYHLTVDYLHSIKQESAPGDILAGIHEKLEKKNSFWRFMEWFRHANPTMSLQAAASTIVIAFAAMFLYKAVLVDNQPADTLNNQTATVTRENSTAGTTRQTLSAENKEQSPGNENIYAENFSQYHGTLQTNITPHGSTTLDISLASTGTGNKAPILYADPIDAYFNNFIDRTLRSSQQRYISPDIYLIVPTNDRDSKTLLYHHLISQNNWNTQFYKNNIMLVSLRLDDLPKLDHLFLQHSKLSNQWLKEFKARSGQKIVTVAVRIQ